MFEDLILNSEQAVVEIRMSKVRVEDPHLCTPIKSSISAVFPGLKYCMNINTLTTVRTGSEYLHPVLTTVSQGHESAPRVVFTKVLFCSSISAER